MSSDGYFSDEFDASLLNQISAIEAAYLSPKKLKEQESPPPPPAQDDSDFDFSFDDYGAVEAELQRIEQEALKKQAAAAQAPQAGPSRQPLARAPSKNTVQTTLFGDVLQPQGPTSKHKSSNKPPLQRIKSNSRNPFGKPARKTKQWDHTAFAKNGWKRGPNSKRKDKTCGDDEDEDELLEFEQYPDPVLSSIPPSSMKLQADRLATNTWIYPLNKPKRDYQFNIVRNSLFENTLVALPTGLGKTFIAGVVMLNFYRWFPDGKVVFVAPTKPLVAQQIEACHKTCGIPGTDAAELTGNVTRAIRARHWERKRVFYMTPQTLMNDLAMNNCDPTDIILLVVDEAHKGTGDYAYAQVVRYMMAKNPHFRILALTATPGGKPEVVQEIVDSLHISRIEIRDENSIDLRGYMHKKITEQHKIVMHEDIVKIRTLLAKIMEEKIKPLRSSNILRGNVDPVSLQPFRCNMTMQEIGGREDSKSLSWAYPVLKVLGQLARAMGYLLECSSKMCYNSLKEISQGGGKQGGKKTSGKPTQNSLSKHPCFQELMKEFAAQYSRGLAAHPKMEKLKAVVLDHFVKASEDPLHDQETKVMVFVTYRECVDEIVEWLNQESPMIRATKFVGQSTDKQGNKGFGQKEQLEIIQKFKTGEFNVLVATSVGEEGLDIGELDMVVCYDVQSTPIRMLQRIGRTGRKRDGYIHVLVAESREESNWAKAKEKYEEVQQSIVRGEQVELYGDVERLLPDDVAPQCVEMEMDIQEYVRETKEKAAPLPAGHKSPSGGKKRKRDDDPLRNLPPGAMSGFLSARELIVKGATKKRKKPLNPSEHAGEDDDVDEEIQGGVFGPRRTESTPAIRSSSKPKKLRKANTAVDHPKRTKVKKKKAMEEPELTSSQLLRQGEDDSDDMEIERGLIMLRGSTSRDISPMRGSTSSRSTSYLARTVPSSPDVPLADVYEIDSDPPSDPASDRRSMDVCNRHVVRATRASSELVDINLADSDGDLQVQLGGVVDDTPSSPLPDHEANVASQDMSWLLDDDDDLAIHIVNSSPSRDAPQDTSYVSDEDILPQGGLGRPMLSSPRPNPTTLPIDLHSSPSIEMKSVRRDMLPPPLPIRLQTALDVFKEQEPAMPEPSFAIRAPKCRKQRPVVIPDIGSSPVVALPKRLRRIDPATSPERAPPMKQKQKRRRPPVDSTADNPWIEAEAAHSGDDSSEGESDDFEEIANESDLRFLQELPETQVSPSYDQTAAYRESLFTQAPVSGRGPIFANRPVRQGRFGPDRAPRLRHRISSSPPRGDDVPDEYAVGSFIVDDDAEISYQDDSSEL